jgi:putative ABC transport system ATP-binding protein
MGFIEVARLYKAYHQGPITTPVLREVSLSVQRGSFTAIVGPSGCGKTTLLGVLGALDRGDSGKVVVDGLDLMQATARELVEYRRRAVGIVFQFYNLLPTLTAVENVEAGLEFTSLPQRSRRAQAMGWLDRVGLAPLAHRFPAQLSGGQQQRVAVARVLAREPKLCLADEPTGNLDAESGELIFQCLASLTRESGTTCIMVTHDTSLQGRVDEVVHLHDGRVVEVPAPTRSGEVVALRARAESRLGRIAGAHR